jgi:hypothetical protein
MGISRKVVSTRGMVVVVVVLAVVAGAAGYFFLQSSAGSQSPAGSAQPNSPNAVPGAKSYSQYGDCPPCVYEDGSLCCP